MRLTNEAAAIAFRALNKCSSELEPDGPWRWRCAIENGTRLPIAASLQEGFLHLRCRPAEIREGACTPEDAVLGNNTLPGGVKLAMCGASNALNLVTDIAVVDERQLLDRIRWALDGFHDGHLLLTSPESFHNRAAAQPTVSAAGLGELLREASWPSTERGSNDFSAELDANTASPARIRMGAIGVVLSSELARSSAAAETSRQALTVFLLTATNTLRLARAYAEKVDGGLAFGVQVDLPCAPAGEEIDHALAALSIAHQMCAREASVLLNEATARCYLAARDLSTINHHQSKQEN
ncbi:MAG: hypothetical protein ACLQG3_04955 [Terracidiphilus sp.]